MPEIEIGPSTRLAKISNLLSAFHSNDISYCHWKSNEHLDASMSGDTDLDILFREDQKEKIESILNEFDFKLFHAIKQKQYKDIVDYIGIDLPSGKIIHIHTHYRLTMGEPYLKGYQFDFEDKILETRIFNEEFGIYCSSPAIELILLYLRECLKLRNRDIIFMHLKNRVDYRDNILSEYNWLKAKASEVEVQAILKTFVNDDSSIYSLVTSEFNRKQLHKFAPLIKKEFASNRLYAPSTAMFLRWYREATVLTSRKLANYLARPIVSKRINPRGGLVVAVIGADGSGKSSITRSLKETFEQKLDIYKIYFGRGDGRISASRRLLKSIKTLLLPGESNGTEKKPRDPNIRKEGFVRSTYKCLEALLVAQEKKNNLKLMQLARKRGLLIICDRYPQNQIMGYNDGPLLHDLLKSSNFLFRAAAKRESKIYAQTESVQPDILFKLIADADVVEARKPGETSLEKLEAKINGIKQLRLNDACKVVTVDAEVPLKEVLYKIKKETWEVI